MKLFLLGLIWIGGLVLDIHAQAEFRYHVSNMVRSDKLSFERIQQIEISSNDDGTARAFFNEYFYVYGIKQAEFTYQPVEYYAKLPAESYKEFLQSVGKLDPTQLEKETEGSGLFVWGNLNMGEKEYRIRAAPDSKERMAWEALFLDLRRRFPPAAGEQKETVVLQGDLVAPVEVSFADLLKTPKKYAGKRVRVLGYYHGEFEGSHFSRAKENSPDYEHELWLDGVDTTKINDAYIVVDATFDPDNHGHMDLWQGALSRASSIRKATNKEVKQGGVGKPAAVPGSKSEDGDKLKQEKGASR